MPRRPPPAAIRADAMRNRGAIVAAATRLYGRRGLEAPLDDIAREAGVGNATLYRHFPTRCDLLAAVFTDTLQRVIDAAEDALQIIDPWAAFTGHLHFLCHLQASNRGLADLLTTAVPGSPDIERLRRRAYRDVVRLAQRAQADGSLRAEFTPEDLALFLMANAGLVHRTADIGPDASSRFIQLVIAGLRPSATPIRVPAPTATSVRQAMIRRGHDLGYS